MLDRRLPPVLQ